MSHFRCSEMVQLPLLFDQEDHLLPFDGKKHAQYINQLNMQPALLQLDVPQKLKSVKPRYTQR